MGYKHWYAVDSVWRRILSIVLLVVFSLPLLAQATTWTQRDTDANLPACCRRHGAHECHMKQLAQPQDKHEFSERCPFRPLHGTPALSEVSIGLPCATGLTLPPVNVEALCAAAETSWRTARERSRHKRGPPALAL
jgi:hypothetical protein